MEKTIIDFANRTFICYYGDNERKIAISYLHLIESNNLSIDKEIINKLKTIAKV